MLTHVSRQAQAWLIYNVRHNFGMRSVDQNFVYKAAEVLRECGKSSTTRDEGFRLSVMRSGMRSVLKVGVRARKLPTKHFQQTSAEPLACFVRRAMRVNWKVSGSRLSGRTSTLTHSLPSRSATSSGDYTFVRPTPNQALQPTRMLVTFCAYAQPAPSTRVADL